VIRPRTPKALKHKGGTPQGYLGGDMALHGKRIVVTRAAHQQEPFLRALEMRGAVPIGYPCIDIALTTDTAALDRALNTLAREKHVWLVLSSQNSVHALKARAGALGFRADALSHVQVAAVGQKTLAAVKEAFQTETARASLMPKHFGQDELLPLLSAMRKQRVVLLQGNLSDDQLYQALHSNNANVMRVQAYTTTRVRPSEPLANKIKAGLVDAITFTCPSSARGCLENLSEEGYAWQQGLGAAIACIGKSTAREVERLGLVPDVIAKTHTLDGLLDALEAHFA